MLEGNPIAIAGAARDRRARRRIVLSVFALIVTLTASVRPGKRRRPRGLSVELASPRPREPFRRHPMRSAKQQPPVPVRGQPYLDADAVAHFRNAGRAGVERHAEQAVRRRVEGRALRVTGICGARRGLRAGRGGHPFSRLYLEARGRQRFQRHARLAPLVVLCVSNGREQAGCERQQDRAIRSQHGRAPSVPAIDWGPRSGQSEYPDQHGVARAFASTQRADAHRLVQRRHGSVCRRDAVPRNVRRSVLFEPFVSSGPETSARPPATFRAPAM